jgi:tRNA A-37 threonylcarbamoyl transferase component Bud32
MNMRGVRHGDLTSPHVIVRNNSPIVIDWAESRVFTDPAPDKREEGDSYWMHKTMRGMIG